MGVYEFAREALARGGEVRIIDYPVDERDQTGRPVREDRFAVMLPPVGDSAPIPEALNEVSSDDADRVATLVGIVDERGIELWPDPPFLALLAAEPEVVEGLEQAGNYVMQLEQSLPAIPAGTPEWFISFSKRLVSQAYHCKSEEEAVLAARRLLHKERRRISAERVEALVEVARGAWALRSQMAQPRTPIKWLNDAIQKRAGAPVDDGTEGNIGRAVSAMVDERRRRQRERPVQNGDIPDRGHVELAPFVDVFTGDRDICGWLVECRARFQYARNVEPVRSRHLRDVVSWLARVPMPGPGEDALTSCTPSGAHRR